ncbi:MAG: apolipoprotein N-acyltransferase [Rhodospirillales bacterium]|nr:apolipoprotein N-acyltransferase [Rhodospirillales bacterium]
MSFSVGALASLSMAPLNGWPVLFVALPLLYAALVYSPSGKRAFALGWLFGFGYFAFSLSWIGNALLVEGNPYKWAWPLAVSGLPALLAFFPAFAALTSHKLFNLRSVSGWLGFVSMTCGFEWLRGHVFTGFPWNLFGYTWADHLPVLQILWLSDVYMLTWLTVLWASAPGVVILLPATQRAWPIVIALISFAGCYGYGLAVLPDTPDFNKDVRVRIVQPNIDQAEKWQPDKMAAHFRKHLQLSENTDDYDLPTIIVWPETAVSYRLLDAPQAMEDLKATLSSQPDDSVLLTGFLRFDANNESYGNSLVMIKLDGSVSNVYDKHHLVPFGEYIPFQKWIPLAPVVQFKGFEAGPGVQTFKAPGGALYSPLICYEIIFPGRSVAAGTRPDFIVNVTNDAWYGNSAGPHQHLTQALFRAIESGVPVIRSANTGFSAIISPYGYFIHKTELFKTQRFDSALPQNRDDFLDTNAHKHIFSLIILLFFILQGTYNPGKSSKSG